MEWFKAYENGLTQFMVPPDVNDGGLSSTSDLALKQLSKKVKSRNVQSTFKTLTVGKNKSFQSLNFIHMGISILNFKQDVSGKILKWLEQNDQYETNYTRLLFGMGVKAFSPISCSKDLHLLIKNAAFWNDTGEPQNANILGLYQKLFGWREDFLRNAGTG